MLLTTMSTNFDVTKRKQFAMPRRTFQVLTLNGVTTVAAVDHVTLNDSLRKCNRLRGVDFSLVSLIEPTTGRYVELSEESSLYSNCLLILQSNDLSYQAQTEQHDFRRRIQTRQRRCQSCSTSIWLRRPWLCQVCDLLVCSQCRKSVQLRQCDHVSHHHQHFASSISRFKSKSTVKPDVN